MDRWFLLYALFDGEFFDSGSPDKRHQPEKTEKHIGRTAYPPVKLFAVNSLPDGLCNVGRRKFNTFRLI
jgi:hypothetical protein